MNLLEIMKDEKDLKIELLEKVEAYEKILQEKQRQLEKTEEKLAEVVQVNRNLAKRLKAVLEDLEQERNKSMFQKMKDKLKM